MRSDPKGSAMILTSEPIMKAASVQQGHRRNSSMSRHNYCQKRDFHLTLRVHEPSNCK